MQYLVTWDLEPSQRNFAQERFASEGAPPPEGIEVLTRWHLATGRGGLCVAQTEDPVALGSWIQEWSQWMRFEIQPVLGDEDLVQVIGK